MMDGAISLQQTGWLDFAVEKLTGKLCGEVEALAERHAQEFSFYRSVKGSPNVAWANYFALSEVNRFAIVTARDRGKLVGYLFYCIGRDQHYQHIIKCDDDTFFILPEYRGGWTGYNFLKFADAAMSKTGAHILAMVNKVKSDYSPIWRRLGYQPEDIRWTRLVTRSE